VLDGAEYTFQELEIELQRVRLALPALLAESMAWNSAQRTAC
jgi:hypothetical protein